jgi:uncharacterized membrane protein
VPLLGLAIGAAMGAITGALTDVGIDDNMINEMRSQITPGTSALFLMTSNAVTDKLATEFQDMRGHMELISSNLSNEQEANLREIFGAEAVPTAPTS